MRKVQIILLLGFVLLLGQSALAQSVTWSAPQNVAGASDVLTGNIFEAYGFGPGGLASTTINGVTFSPFVVSGGSSATYGNLTLSNASGIGGAAVGTFSSPDAPFASLPLAYQYMLGSSAYTNCVSCSAPLDVMLSGLTIGTSYQIEVWVNDSRGVVGPYRTETLSGSTHGNLAFNTGSEGGLGQYILGTFTAGAPRSRLRLPGSTAAAPRFPTRHRRSMASRWCLPSPRQ